MGMPDAIAALTKLVKKAKPETTEQINKRKSNLANNNRKMAASAAAGKKSPPRNPLDGLKNERKPKPPRGKLSPQQIKEIDRQKASSRRQSQKTKVEQKKR